MSQKSQLILAFVAGMVGSAIMHYALPPLAFAQDQTSVAKEVRAQSFVLVDPESNVIGTFTSAPSPGVYSQLRGALGSSVKIPSQIVLRDPNGRVIWTPETNTKLLPLSMK